jgi:hypothetical protein
MKHILTAVAFAMATTANAEPQNNLQFALDAARNMEWDSVWGENRAFLLIKRETIRSEVGLIFGYVDNEVACEAIARALSQSGTVGTFGCDAVH